MSPDTGTTDNIPTCRVPVNVCHPVIHVEVLLDRYSCDNHKSAFWRPVYAIAVLLFYRSDEFEVSSRAWDLFRAEKGDRGFGGNIRASNSFTSSDQHKTIAIRLPSKVYDWI